MNKLILALTIFLTGCSTTGLYVITPESSKHNINIQIEDSRSPLSREGGRPSILETYYYHGDAAFSPSKIELFKSAVGSAFEKTPQKITLVSFDVIDSYAKRRGVAQSAGLAGISYSAAILSSSSLPDSDFILCHIEAIVDGKKISSSSISPYKEDPLSMNVFSDPSYTKAVDISIKDALAKWVESAKTTK